MRALVEASGVRKSWETAATRSRRAFSISRSRSAASSNARAMRLKSVGEPGDLVVALDPDLGVQLASGDALRPGPHPLDAAG